MKSIQLILNELMIERNTEMSITAAAFSKARKKLLHTAYTELNEGIIERYYKDDDIKRFKGYRLLAFDASKIILPNTKEIKKVFGSRQVSNQLEKDLGEYSGATYQACYDVLNHIAVKSHLGGCDSYEVEEAEAMLPELKENDLLIYDRGYASYAFMASLIKQNKAFLIRCPRSFLCATRKMFEDNAPETETVSIQAPAHQQKKVNTLGLPTTINIRLLRVVLSSGEVEVLATSLLDTDELSAEDFKHVYGLRWGVETFFSKVKGRLGLENFTGKSAESVRQDFWSTIFISNFETIITEDTEQKLNEEKGVKNKQVKINKAVSFNAIKNMAFEIFSNEKDKVQLIEKLERLFSMNTMVVRENRKVPRKKSSKSKSLNFQKRIRKHVF